MVCGYSSYSSISSNSSNRSSSNNNYIDSRSSNSDSTSNSDCCRSNTVVQEVMALGWMRTHRHTQADPQRTSMDISTGMIGLVGHADTMHARLRPTYPLTPRTLSTGNV